MGLEARQNNHYREEATMSEIIYILTIVFVVYVIYVAEGDGIVAFIHKVFRIDLTHPHECCMSAINYFRKSEIFKWRLPI
jgi:hypothetical protein